MNILSELNTLGILRQTQTQAKLSWMSNDEKRFMLLMLEAKESGISKREILAEEKQQPELSLRLTSYSMAYWAKDKYGRDSHLLLTHQGVDAAEHLLVVAKNLTKSTYHEA